MGMMQDKKWSELSTTRRAFIIMMGVVQVALLAAAFLDLRGRTGEEVNGSKRLWYSLLPINFVGPIAYFVWGRKR